MLVDRCGGLKKLLAGLALFASAMVSVGATLPDAAERMASGVRLREQGLLDQAIAEFQAARSSDSQKIQTRAAGELGATHLQARRYAQAEEFLKSAYGQSTGADRARYAMFLGNLAMARKQFGPARSFYQEAVNLSPGTRDMEIAVGLNLARLLPPAERLNRLQAIAGLLADSPVSGDRAVQHLNLASQARSLGAGATELAYRHALRSAELAQAAGDQRLLVQSDDVLAQIYEDQGRATDALTLTRRGIDRAAALESSRSADLLIQLEWRLGRLFSAAGRLPEAQAAYRRAVAHIESIRQDIPIAYEDGRSSFSATLEPVFIGYVNAVLRQLDSPAAMNQTDQLRSVVQTIELMRQSEIQDFLGDRCTVEAVQGLVGGTLPAGSAVLYPIVLADRMELLLVTPEGIQRRTTAVPEAMLKATANDLARRLRDGLDGFLPPSRRLNDWILKPFDDAFKTGGVTSLVVAPSGVLRLVPIAVLHDGQQFAIERFSVSIVTGMTMTNMSPKAGRTVEALVAGVSYPGPVVDKLGPTMMTAVAESDDVSGAEKRGLSSRPQTRSVRDGRATATGAAARGSASDAMKERLALPGVKEEVDALRSILPGINMLNQDFTLGHFSAEAESGRYRIFHIATHGFFGGSAETSFIMAYDDLLTIDGLQSLLKSESFEKNPIELLSLSACQTAQGNDRAPLGISGAAIKARAKSVIGTLWPVDDDAAKTLMQSLYLGITRDGLSKTDALRKAQLELLHASGSQGPFFWAPFVLIGNWL